MSWAKYHASRFSGFIDYYTLSEPLISYPIWDDFNEKLKKARRIHSVTKQEQYKEMLAMRAIIKNENDLTLDKSMILHCMNGDVEELKEALAAGANQHYIDGSGSNAMIYASGYGSKECLAILLENATKEDLEVVNIFGHSAITIASRYEDVGIPMNSEEKACVGMIKAKLEKLELESELGNSYVEAPRRRMRM